MVEHSIGSSRGWGDERSSGNGLLPPLVISLCISVSVNIILKKPIQLNLIYRPAAAATATATAVGGMGLDLKIIGGGGGGGDGNHHGME